MRKDIFQTKYNLFEERLPYGLHENTRSIAFHMANAIGKADLPKIDFVASLPATSWSRESSYLRIFPIGRFRKPYPVISQLSRVLAPLYLEFLVLPVLYPVPIKIWECHAKTKTRLWHEIRRSGLVIFQRVDRLYDFKR